MESIFILKILSGLSHPYPRILVFQYFINLFQSHDNPEYNQATVNLNQLRRMCAARDKVNILWDRSHISTRDNSYQTRFSRVMTTIIALASLEQ